MIQVDGSVQVAPLAEEYDVSTQTIRKDLKYLEDCGIATRSYGGAILNTTVASSSEEPVEKRKIKHSEEKQQIGRLAASLVQPGDSIILDSGTTTVQIAHYLPDSEEISVITNDFGVLAELAHKKNINIIVLGGQLRRKNMAFYGSQTEVAIEGFNANKFFLGVDGLHLTKGVTTHHEEEAILNRAMVKAADEVILVTDSSKYGRVCMHKVVGLEEASKIVTDSKMTLDTIKELEDIGLEVVSTQ